MAAYGSAAFLSHAADMPVLLSYSSKPAAEVMFWCRTSLHAQLAAFNARSKVAGLVGDVIPHECAHALARDISLKITPTSFYI